MKNTVKKKAAGRKIKPAKAWALSGPSPISGDRVVFHWAEPTPQRCWKALRAMCGEGSARIFRKYKAIPVLITPIPQKRSAKR